MWQLIINGPGYFDTAYELPEGETLLGRADENDVILSGDQVSRRHARLFFDNNELFFEDLGSRNGTRVNGSFLVETHHVQDGDIFTIGENTMAVRRPTEFEVAKTELLAEDDPLRASLPEQPFGEVLVSRSIEENPFLENIGLLDNFSVQDFEMLPLIDNFGSSTGEIPLRPQKSDKVAPPNKKDRVPEQGELLLFAQVSEKLNNATSLKAFLDEVMALIVEVSHATTGIAFMFDEKGKLSPVAVRNVDDKSSEEMPISRSIIGEVARKKVALAVINAQSDAHFANSESVIMYGLEQVICAPMLKGDDLLGVIYLNRPSKPTKSMPLFRLVDIVNALAHMLASGVEKWSCREQNLAEIQRRHRLERFHSSETIDRLLHEKAFQLGVLEKKQATAMILELSGIARACEVLPAEKISDLLSCLYDVVRGHVFRFGGTICQSTGDSMLAVFGTPFSKDDDADRAIRCAQACRSECTALLEKTLPEGLVSGVRITLNTGMILAGPLGSMENFDYVFLGHTMNLAKRLQSMAKLDDILITEDTFKSSGGHFSVQPSQTFEQKVKPHKVHVYEVMEGDVRGDARRADAAGRTEANTHQHAFDSELDDEDSAHESEPRTVEQKTRSQKSSSQQGMAASQVRPTAAETTDTIASKKVSSRPSLRSIPPLPRVPSRPSTRSSASGQTEEPRPAIRPMLPPLPNSKKAGGSSASTVVASLPDILQQSATANAGSSSIPPIPRPRPLPGSKAPRPAGSASMGVKKFPK